MRRISLLFAASRRGNARETGSMPRISNKSRTDILAESWSTISNEYGKVLVPRFAPWEKEALDTLQDAVENEMKFDPSDTKPCEALVLCCGPGHELLPIARILGPNSRVLGNDLAPGMIDVAKKRIEKDCSQDDNIMYKECIAAKVGDAMNPPPGPYHVIFSAFGLQQLPDPLKAINNWIGVLRPGGVCAFIYWPPDPQKIPGQDDDPFVLWGELVKRKLGKQGKEHPWDENIDDAVVAAGGEIIDIRHIIHDICWKDGKDMFDGMSRSGPWHAMRLRRGDDFVDELGEELQSSYPPGECLCHKFTATMVLARRQLKGAKQNNQNW